MPEPVNGSAFERRRALLLHLFDAAVKAAHPAQALPLALPPPPDSGGRILLLSTGKAGGSMMAAAVDHYHNTLGVPANLLFGLGTARHGYEGSNPLIRMASAGHPMPDAGSVAATVETLALARQARPEDMAVILMSGGGSANWIAPAGMITLEEKQAITKALLRSGAHIGEINCVRKHLSRIKGGRLAACLAAHSIVTLAISDVPGDDPSTIASGPTVADPTTQADALAILAKFKVPLPASVQQVLTDPKEETPKPGDKLFDRCRFEITTRPRDGLNAAIAAAADAGYEVISLGPDIEGEARDVAAQHARMALDLRAAGRRAIILSGGELTVTIRGEGAGGPNQEYALALAAALDGAKGIAAMAADTDGTDGGRGDPADPAGALIDETTLARAKQAGLDLAAHLANNNSTPFFKALGDLVSPGPTLTNANDLRAVLVDP
ncbi:MAG: glycerate kinase type-2 family protein [Beijerinckiaceae bacterium]